MTRITTPFSTADEVAAGIDLTGKRVIVTGASSGVGIETARALAGTGAEVTLAVRDTAAGQRVAADITGTTGNKDVRVATWTWRTGPRSRRSPSAGTGRCTRWSTTRVWRPCPS